MAPPGPAGEKQEVATEPTLLDSQAASAGAVDASLSAGDATQELPPGFLYKVFVLSLQGHCRLSFLCTMFWFSNVWVLLLSSSLFCVIFFFHICFPFTLTSPGKMTPSPCFEKSRSTVIPSHASFRAVSV